MDAPSAPLRTLLTELQLVSPTQWRRCKGAVRAFVKDLPAFDSVWIDGLVQIQALTLLQAEWLSRGEGGDLAVGPFILEQTVGIDELLTSYEARHRKTGERTRLTRWRISSSAEDLAAVRDRIQSLVTTSRQVQQRSRILRDLVTEVYEQGKSLWCAAGASQGITAAMLLTRRGRFPEDVVRGVAVQILRLLAEAEGHGLPHGDIRPSNLLLTATGRITLIQHGLLSAIFPLATIHDPLPLEFLDGLSPERVRDPIPASISADIYAAGCLLWQLLAGRPPHLSADPLGKRAAHGKRRIPEIREFAPSASEPLAQLITAMTEPDPQKRPGSVNELQGLVRSLGGSQEQRLAGFVRSFETASTHPWWQAEFLRTPPVSPPRGTNRWTTAATVALAMAGGLIARPYLQQQWTSGEQPLALDQKTGPSTPDLVPSPIAVASLEVHVENPSEPAILSLPAPDSAGVVQLEGGKVYRSAELRVAGQLTIQAPVHKPALILIDQEPLTVSATVLKIQGVELHHVAESQVSALLNVEAQALQLETCRWTSDVATPGLEASIVWTVPQPDSSLAGQLRIQNTGFLNGTTAVRLNSPLMGALIENVLKSGAGALLDLQQGTGAGYQVRLVTNQVTLCESGPLVKVPMESVETSGTLLLEGADSAFAPAGDHPLILLEGDLLSKTWHEHFQVAASGLVLQEGRALVGFRGTAGSTLSRIVTPIDSSTLDVDGLLIGRFQFAGVNLSDSNDCLAIVDQIPLHLPGSPLGATLDAFLSPALPAKKSTLSEPVPPRSSPLPFPPLTRQ